MWVLNVCYWFVIERTAGAQPRYLGQFDGVIIAELALAGLGNFNFQFDPVFPQVPILPRLQPAEQLNVRP